MARFGFRKIAVSKWTKIACLSLFGSRIQILICSRSANHKQQCFTNERQKTSNDTSCNGLHVRFRTAVRLTRCSYPGMEYLMTKWQNKPAANVVTIMFPPTPSCHLVCFISNTSSSSSCFWIGEAVMSGHYGLSWGLHSSPAYNMPWFPPYICCVDIGLQLRGSGGQRIE